MILNNNSLSHLVITFVNSLDPDQARQNVGPDQDPNCLTLMVILKEFFKKKVMKKKSSGDEKKHEKLPSR